jgi:branched-chain amino acid transport system ATP-binding protein
MMELLRTERLSRSFGSLQAVLDVDFAVEAGELRSIIGPNGAGKSTFFRLIAGDLPPSAGRIRFKGRDLAGLPHHAVSRLGIVKSYQITSVFPHLTALENVRVAAQSRQTAYNFWQPAAALREVRHRAERALAAVGLAARASRPAAHLSHGEKRHLEIGIALATDPELLLLDEPTAGMSPEETEQTMRLIGQIATGRTVVLVEHNMKLVMAISRRITVLHQGQILAEGTPAEIRADDRVQQVYLGGA